MQIKIAVHSIAAEITNYLVNAQEDFEFEVLGACYVIKVHPDLVDDVRRKLGEIEVRRAEAIKNLLRR